MLRRLRRILPIVVVSLLGLVVVAVLAGTLTLRGSRARLEGSIHLAGLEQPVTVSRDSLGIPDISAQTRVDAARALGYLHAQDRFFQMDLQRRNAAGELAALLGPALVGTDRDTRRHRFRARAAQVLAAADARELELQYAYAAGVNAGLDDLKIRPFEYLILRQQPKPWLPEDSVLTMYAMFLDLSLSTARTERAWATVRDNVPAALAEFLLPHGNPWEAPLQTAPVPGFTLPDSVEFDVRSWLFGGRSYQQYREDERAAKAEPITPPRHDTAGSNNWAIAGSLTGHGGAIMANDMHLGHGLPNIWYRARLSWSEGGQVRSVVGATLPGTAAVVVGSNEQVAWGFTNSYGDWVDLVILETDPDDSTRYRTPDGWRSFEHRSEVIDVAGSEPDTLWFDETIWGPLWSKDSKGRPLALRWIAHDPQAVNLALMGMENVADVEQAAALAGAMGIPPLNMVCADSQGRIAWMLAGRIPRRVGWDGRLPVSWADGSCRWDGYINPTEQPRIIDPAEGRLWTANNRVNAGQDLQVIGDGGYALGYRALQIRDDLRALEYPLEKDLLKVQLDDRARFHGLWRDLAVEVLQRAKPAANSHRGEFLRLLRDEWNGRAAVESASYYLARNFTYECVDGVYSFLTTGCQAADPDFDPRWLSYRHAGAWAILQARPNHLLPPWCEDWDDFVLQAVDRTVNAAAHNGRALKDFTWGTRNVVKIEHPFVQIAPQLKRWLAAPELSQPGDSFMPRVQHSRHGASQRIVVSPGREEDGLFHMPGGQSGHPLSPFFLAGHQAWVSGRATPLLPGAPRYRLEMKPSN
jgi:penicillin G amidase